jgi:anhydro-N-acetylmuramic acid kinase
VQFVSSHGHTIFHNPKEGYTYQIGQGSSMAAACGLPVICDFRTLDVASGGEGAPLVPIGDKLLFSEYTFCLNLGGIANISFDKNDIRYAFDVCPLNLVLNEITEKEFICLMIRKVVFRRKVRCTWLAG